MPEAQSRQLKINSFLAKIKTMPDEGIDNMYEFEAGGTDDNDEKKPEHYLVSAVLEVGLADYVELRCNPSKREKNTSRWIEVRRWIYSDSEEPFTFIWCLSHLFPEPERIGNEIRKKVQALTQVEEFYFRELLKGNYKSFKQFQKNEILNRKLQEANANKAL